MKLSKSHTVSYSADAPKKPILPVGTTSSRLHDSSPSVYVPSYAIQNDNSLHKRGLKPCVSIDLSSPSMSDCTYDPIEPT